MKNVTPPFALWVTGLSGAGKTTILRELVPRLARRGIPVVIVSPADIRRKIFDRYRAERIISTLPAERTLSYKVSVLLAETLLEKGIGVIFESVDATEEGRRMIKRVIPVLRIVYVKCPLKVCMRREIHKRGIVKGFYKAARDGMAVVAGYNAPYRIPKYPWLTLDTVKLRPEAAAKILDRNIAKRILR